MAVVRLRFGVFILMAVSSVITAEKLQAECGDYVIVGGSSSAVSHDEMPSPPPCHGPNCEAVPLVPVPGLPPSYEFSISDTACLNSTAWMSTGSGPRHRAESWSGLSAGYADDLLRPPQS
ncbi:MAG: hypothetical protein VB878_05260 [Pirellulaceae bacterium]